jgi:hypothetical protein
VPATRSRTEQWRRSLRQLYERGGSLEISIARPGDEKPEDESRGVDMIFRCRVLGVTDEEILLQRPITLGQPVPITGGVRLIGVIAIGQNRWMFKTACLGPVQVDRGGQRLDALRIEAPKKVERCQRRSFYRVSTTGLVLPKVQARTLLEPASAVAAESAIQTRIEMLREGQVAGFVGEGGPAMIDPRCGPAFAATLMNIGGGGAGLLLQPEEAEDLSRSKPLWLMIDLAPHVPAPLGVVARAAHTHIDSQRRLYAGVAFDFGHHQAYRQFVTDTICRYVQDVQRDQIKAQNEVNSSA